jgi:hypothetical protein
VPSAPPITGEKQMGLFTGIDGAEVFERGKYVKPGFHGVLEVVKTIAKETRKSGDAFIVEFKIVETNMPAHHPMGSKATWFQKMVDKDVAYPAIAAWAAAMGGLDASDKKGIEEHVLPELEEALDAATDSPRDNDFTGRLVRLDTELIQTRKGEDFTRYDFSPYNENDEHVRDAVDDVAE